LNSNSRAIPPGVGKHLAAAFEASDRP
jgi:hypothetical protein